MTQPTAPGFTWIVRTNPTEFHAENHRVKVRRITWTKPGFKNVTSSGWAVFVDDLQFTPAYRTPTKAREAADLPGTNADIRDRLGRVTA